MAWKWSDFPLIKIVTDFQEDLYFKGSELEDADVLCDKGIGEFSLRYRGFLPSNYPVPRVEYMNCILG